MAALVFCLWPIVAAAQQPAPVEDAESTTTEAVQAVDDIALAQRLRTVFQAVEGLETIKVEVNGGLVTLSGELLSAEMQERAVNLAREVDGVLEVEDQTSLTAGVSERVIPALEHFLERMQTIAWQLPLFFIGLLVLVLAFAFARWLTRQKWLFGRLHHKPFLRDILAQFVQTAIVLVAALFVLDLLGLTALVGAVLGAAELTLTPPRHRLN